MSHKSFGFLEWGPIELRMTPGSEAGSQTKCE